MPSERRDRICTIMALPPIEGVIIEVKKALVFAPHPDDETLGCGGTIAMKLSEGYDISIIFMTHGGNAYLNMFGITTEPTPKELKEIRKEEAKRAAKILGLKEENLLFLDIEDETLEKNERRAREEAIEILNGTLPVEVYFPYEKDFHVDHRATNRIVRDSITELCLHPIEYRYSIGKKYQRLSSLKEAILDLIKHNRVHVNISKFLPLKKMALKKYKSQIMTLSNRQKDPVLRSSSLKRHLKNEETFFIDSCARDLLEKVYAENPSSL